MLKVISFQTNRLYSALSTHILEADPTNKKKLCLVDAGLHFNSPYPLMLRPERGVDIIISFDFSARPKDKGPLLNVGIARI